MKTGALSRQKEKVGIVSGIPPCEPFQGFEPGSHTYRISIKGPDSTKELYIFENVSLIERV